MNELDNLAEIAADPVTTIDPRISHWYWSHEDENGPTVAKRLASIMCSLHIALLNEEFSHEEATTLVAAWFNGGFASVPKNPANKPFFSDNPPR